MKGDMLDSITVSLSTMLLLLGVKRYLGQSILIGFSLPMILVGAIILILGKRIIKDFDMSVGKRLITNSVGLTLLLTGISYFLDQYSNQYAWIYIIIALVIFHYRNEIVDQIV